MDENLVIAGILDPTDTTKGVYTAMHALRTQNWGTVLSLLITTDMI